MEYIDYNPIFCYNSYMGYQDGRRFAMSVIVQYGMKLLLLVQIAPIREVVSISTYEEFMILISLATLIVLIIQYIRKK